jgi:hypothetical protein
MVSHVATWDDVHRPALALPQTAEGLSRDGLLAWSVKDKRFAGERPLRREASRRSATPLSRPVLAARAPHLRSKEALLADDGGVYFTTPHFSGPREVASR